MIEIQNCNVKQELISAIDNLKANKTTENIKVLKDIMERYNLHIVDGKIVPKNKKEYSDYVTFWNQRQQARKILLNSLYGALLNESMKFYDKRIGQSVTLTGRSVTKHMSSETNRLITGKYEIGESVVYSDTDSVLGSSTIPVKSGVETNIPIEELFEQCTMQWANGEKEYAADSHYQVLGYNGSDSYYTNFNYIYRHKTEKEMFEIENEFGDTVIVTEDHSCMVERNGVLMTVKPKEIMEDDVIISI